MLVFAAVDIWDKLKNVPLTNWLYLGGGIVVLCAGVFVFKRAVKMNRIIFVILSTMIVVVVLMNWVYNRTEPAFLTPVIDKIAPFFPSTPPPISKRPDAGEPGAGKKSGGAANEPAKSVPTTTIKSAVY